MFYVMRYLEKPNGTRANHHSAERPGETAAPGEGKTGPALGGACRGDSSTGPGQSLYVRITAPSCPSWPEPPMVIAPA